METRQESRSSRNWQADLLGGLAWKALLIAAIALVAMPFGSATASPSKGEFGFGAFAYGTQAVVANILRSGATAAVGLGGGCTTAVGVKHENSAASAKLPHVLGAGTLHTRVESKKTKSGLAATGSAVTQDVNLLNGLIKASAVRAVSTTAHNSSTGKFSVSGAGSKLVGLVIHGHHIKLTPKPNTRIKLPGVGYVVLNQQGATSDSKSAAGTVIGIHVVVTLGNKTAAAGTQIFVSAASSSLAGPATGLLVGDAFGVNANIANTILVGPTFPVGLGCLGTRGKTVKNTGAGIKLSHLATSGTITDTAKGNANSKRVYGTTSSTIQKVNVLDGLVKARAIKAAVNAAGQPPKLGDKSSFLGLKVSGHPLIGDSVAPNTHFNVAGLGTLWLHRQIKTSKSITVVMVELVIGTPNNKLHLPVGAEVDVGFASVGVL